MVCPYCNWEMERGVIVCDGRRRPSWFSDSRSKAVAIKKFNVASLLTTYKIEAFYCEGCRKIILDTLDSDG
jgi:hypothetical protein